MPNTPVLDEDVLELLADQLGDVAVLCTFVARYAEMLTGRVERVQAAIATHDLEALADAALSLKTSSEMTGARALSRAIATMLDDMPDPPDDAWLPQEAATVLVEHLQGLATETNRLLRNFLQAQSPEARMRAGLA